MSDLTTNDAILPADGGPVVTVIAACDHEIWGRFAEVFEDVLLALPGARRIDVDLVCGVPEPYIVVETTESVINRTTEGAINHLFASDQGFADFVGEDNPEFEGFMMLLVGADGSITEKTGFGSSPFTKEDASTPFIQKLLHAALPDRFGGPVLTVLGSHCMTDNDPSYEIFEAAFVARTGGRVIEVCDPRSDREVYVVAEMTRGDLAALIAAHPDFVQALAPVGPDELGSTYGFTLIDADMRITMYDPAGDTDGGRDAFAVRMLLHAVFPDRFEKPVLPPRIEEPSTYERMRAQTRALLDRKAA